MEWDLMKMLSAGLIMGADGGIGSTYNCMPELAHKVYDAFVSVILQKHISSKKN